MKNICTLGLLIKIKPQKGMTVIAAVSYQKYYLCFVDRLLSVVQQK